MKTLIFNFSSPPILNPTAAPKFDRTDFRSCPQPKVGVPFSSKSFYFSTSPNGGGDERPHGSFQGLRIPSRWMEPSKAAEKFSQRSRDQTPSSNTVQRSTRNQTGQSQPTAFKSFDVNRKGNKELVIDSQEQQVDSGNLQHATFLNAVVKVYCTHTPPHYSLPWQKQRQYTSTGSAFMIGEGKLLTNAHCVEHDAQVKVKRRGDDTKYVAKVLARGVECDIALLSVESKEFWEGAEPLHFGNLPNLQDPVTVVGYPLGGETISVSKGVVSRIEVTSYAHGSSELLGIQIDAAINPGNSGGPAFNDQGECIGVAFQGDVIVSFENVHVGSEGTVPFRTSERIAFRYLISQKFTGDIAEVGIIRGGQFRKIQVVLNPRVHLVPYHIEGGQPSYLIVAGLVFTPLSEPLIEEECEDSIGLKLLAKARYSMARFKGDQMVILSQVLANEENIGYEDMSNEQVLKLNGMWIRNIHHLAHMVDSCKDKYLVFEFEDNFLVVLERESALASSTSILKSYGIPCERSSDLLEPYRGCTGQSEAMDEKQFGECPVSNSEFGSDGLLWA
ncbi:protease Do-like 2, chloroplastic isoform X5 [Andrographis paniculata]|uniref:protease Do-like 2, chloroplastic isoform X5 n=1 Tax=Andrographis paniculata TaxID=175694 RepID=UPI0021E74657|nr:protease Do-like 2, chloroplastic isoform X5 [Andrographis paniculata]